MQEENASWAMDEDTEGVLTSIGDLGDSFRERYMDEMPYISQIVRGYLGREHP
jgi:hypothetical protein